MADIIKVMGVNIHFNAAERQIVEHLMEGADLTERQAIEQVLSYIREQVCLYESQGNFALCQHLLERIGEWNDEVADRYRDMNSPTTDIYIP
jgi:hypothetical protein